MISHRQNCSKFLSYRVQSSVLQNPSRHACPDALSTSLKKNPDLKIFPNPEEAHSENSNLKKQILILDQMGFSSLIVSKAENQIEELMLKRRFSIGIADFWAKQSREAFLRSKGFQNAYDQLKRKSKKSEIFGISSERKPSLPHIMDMNVKQRLVLRKNLNQRNSTTRSTMIKHDVPLVCQEKDYKRQGVIKDINSLMDKCTALSKDTIFLKNKTECLKSKLRENFQPTKKLKISKLDRKKISHIVSSMDSD